MNMRERDRQTERDRETDRETERQRDRDRDRDRETERQRTSLFTNMTKTCFDKDHMSTLRRIKNTNEIDPRS